MCLESLSKDLVNTYSKQKMMSPDNSLKDAPERGILNLAGEDQHSFSGDGSFERVSRCLFLRRKAMTNLDSVLKSRDITLPTKVHIVKAMVFPVVMYGCENWIIKKSDHLTTDVFKM